jgi:hypothetical protein
MSNNLKINLDKCKRPYTNLKLYWSGEAKKIIRQANLPPSVSKRCKESRCKQSNQFGDLTSRELRTWPALEGNNTCGLAPPSLRGKEWSFQLCDVEGNTNLTMMKISVIIGCNIVCPICGQASTDNDTKQMRLLDSAHSVIFTVPEPFCTVFVFQSTQI